MKKNVPDKIGRVFAVEDDEDMENATQDGMPQGEC